MLFLAIFLLVFSVSLKNKNFEKNINSSISTLESEGTYPSYGVYPRKIVLDNFTDAIMLNTAYSADSNSFRSVMFNERYLSSVDEINQIKNLKSAYTKTTIIKSSYERYWHGYLVFIKPLLSLTSYQGIRYLLGFSLYSSFIFLLYLLFKKREFVKLISILFAALFVDFFYLGQSIHFAPVFLIGIISSILFLSKKIDRNKLPLLFFVVGILTSYFDFLSAPLVSFGFLLIVSTEQEKISYLIKSCLYWSAGYIVFGLSKWILMNVFFYNGALSNAFGHFLNRTIHQPDENFTYLKTIILNVNQLIGYEKLNKIIVLILFIILFSLFIFYRKKKINFSKIIYWLLAGSIPYIWYLIAANHSYLHVWFTYRTQFLSAVSGMIIYLELIDFNKIFKNRKINLKNIS
jgi:hypothetical protein